MPDAVHAVKPGMMQQLLSRKDQASVSAIAQIEKKTEARVVEPFREQLGYDYLGNWDRPRWQSRR